MNILLTGGTGFIGKNLLEGLRGSYTIFAPTHSELEIMDKDAVRKYIIQNNIRVVIHTAVKGGDFVLENTIRMFYSIYNNIDLLDKFINFGSGAEYGKKRDLKKVKEQDLGKELPEDAYGLGKSVCSQIAKGNKKIVTVLPFGIFGKYEGTQYKFISNSIAKNILKIPIKIRQDAIFDYLYIDDLVPIILCLIRNKKIAGDLNITPTQSISLKEVVKIINKVGTNNLGIAISESGMNYQYTGCNQKLRKALPYFKFTSYRKSIERLYSYYLSHISEIDRNVIMQDKYFTKVKTKAI